MEWIVIWELVDYTQIHIWVLCCGNFPLGVSALMSLLLVADGFLMKVLKQICIGSFFFSPFVH